MGHHTVAFFKKTFNLSVSRSARGFAFLPVLIAVGALLVVGGAIGYSKYFAKAKPPEQILQEAIANFVNLKSLAYEGEILAEPARESLLGQPEGPGMGSPIAGSFKELQSVLIRFNGLTDTSVLENPKTSFALDIGIEGTSGEGFSLALESRTLGKLIYLKVTTLPAFLPFNLDFIKEKWIKIDSEEAEKKLKQAQLEEKLNDEALRRNKEKLELTTEQIEKIKQAISKAKLFVITEQFSDEKIDGSAAYHYKITVDKDGLKKLAPEINGILEEKKLDEEKLTELYAQVDKAQFPEADLWIGKKDILPHKLFLDLTVKENNAIQVGGEASITLRFKDFNKPVSIEEPESSVPIEEVIKNLFGAPQMPAVPAQPDATNKLPMSGFSSDEILSSDNDRDGLSYLLENSLCTNPDRSDSDGDGYLDGAEAQNGYNPNGAGTLADYLATHKDDCFDREVDPEARELLKRSRDAQRIVDIGNLRNSLNLYLTTVVEAVLCEDSRTIYTSAPTKIPPGWRAGRGSGVGVDGTGWLPVDLTKTAGGSPISKLSSEPLNDPYRKYVYAYACDPEKKTYELNTKIESSVYGRGSSDDMVSTDGGDNPGVYEVGNDFGLDLVPNDFWK